MYIKYIKLIFTSHRLIIALFDGLTKKPLRLFACRCARVRHFIYALLMYFSVSSDQTLYIFYSLREWSNLTFHNNIHIGM